MKMDIRTGCACAAMLVAMAWSSGADAQRSPWWERQKAANAAVAGAPAAAQAETTTPPAQVPQYAPVVQRETVEGPGYTHVEAGVGRVDVGFYDIDESANGGYVRGSVAVTDNLYVFGGHERVSKSWDIDTERLKATIDQTEIGLGASILLSPRADFVSELSLLRLGAKLYYDDLEGSGHVYAGTLMLGIRARPVSNLELWAKAGYRRVDDNLLIDHSMVGNLGIQYRFTPVWGLVGEAEVYEDVRFYRLGVRASF